MRRKLAAPKKQRSLLGISVAIVLAGALFGGLLAYGASRPLAHVLSMLVGV